MPPKNNKLSPNKELTELNSRLAWDKANTELFLRRADIHLESRNFELADIDIQSAGRLLAEKENKTSISESTALALLTQQRADLLGLQIKLDLYKFKVGKKDIDAYAFLNRGLAYDHQEKFEFALAYFDEASKLRRQGDPNIEDAMKTTLTKKVHHDRIVSLPIKNTDDRLKRGRQYAHFELWCGASLEFDAAVKTCERTEDPQLVEALMLQGYAHLQLKDIATSRRAFYKSLNATTNKQIKSEAWMYLGWIRLNDSSPDNAFFGFENACELDPRNIAALYLKTWMNLVYCENLECKLEEYKKNLIQVAKISRESAIYKALTSDNILVETITHLQGQLQEAGKNQAIIDFLQHPPKNISELSLPAPKSVITTEVPQEPSEFFKQKEAGPSEKQTLKKEDSEDESCSFNTALDESYPGRGSWPTSTPGALRLVSAHSIGALPGTPMSPIARASATRPEWSPNFVFTPRPQAPADQSIPGSTQKKPTFGFSPYGDQT